MKGVVFTSRHNFVRSRYGPAAWQRVLEVLPPGSRKLLAKTVKSGDWYPLTLNEEVDRAICRVLAAGDPQIYRTMGAYSADLTIEGTSPGDVEARNPGGFLRAIDRYAPRYYDGSVAVVELPADGHGILRFYGIRSNEPNCESNLGYFGRGIELCGGRDVRAHENRCTRDGGKFDEYEFTWVPPDAGARGRRR